MNILNDSSCAWVKDLPSRLNTKTLNQNQKCDWLIVGAGYTGLSAARKLGQIDPNKKITQGDLGNDSNDRPGKKEKVDASIFNADKIKDY